MYFTAQSTYIGQSNKNTQKTDFRKTKSTALRNEDLHTRSTLKKRALDIGQSISEKQRDLEIIAFMCVGWHVSELKLASSKAQHAERSSRKSANKNTRSKRASGPTTSKSVNR
jgi:hypothetical protein